MRPLAIVPACALLTSCDPCRKEGVQTNGAEHSPTRSEPKSGGIVKPQPEAEGGSR